MKNLLEPMAWCLALAAVLATATGLSMTLVIDSSTAPQLSANNTSSASSLVATGRAN